MADKSTECPFCNLNRQFLSASASSYAIYDNYPVSEGHALIVPKRHVKSYFDLTKEEQTDCIQLVEEVRKILIDKFNPDGFNVGINDGIQAGQTIMHAHIHVIPRNQGDVAVPEGGIRGVIPNKKIYKT